MDDDVGRMFRESDDLGADSSLWLRPLRLLLERGVPLAPVTVLALRSTEGAHLPFGVLTLTEANRIVFWPPLPRSANMIAQRGRITVVDHVTLELCSRKTHATAYDASRVPVRYAASDLGRQQAWRLRQVPGTGLAVWFVLAVQWTTLVDQDRAVQRCAYAPTPEEAKRRKSAFACYAGQCQF